LLWVLSTKVGLPVSPSVCSTDIDPGGDGLASARPPGAGAGAWLVVGPAAVAVAAAAFSLARKRACSKISNGDCTWVGMRTARGMGQKREVRCK
jgi:hypothetical protein